MQKNSKCNEEVVLDLMVKRGCVVGKCCRGKLEGNRGPGRKHIGMIDDQVRMNRM